MYENSGQPLAAGKYLAIPKYGWKHQKFNILDFWSGNKWLDRKKASNPSCQLIDSSFVLIYIGNRIVIYM